jgi:hypothetical protein
MKNYIVEFAGNVGYCETLAEAKRVALRCRSNYLQGSYKKYVKYANSGIVIYKRVMSVGELV